MEKPNLFDYATSELSQDAFLCWFIAWADKGQIKNDKILNKCACDFVRGLLEVSENYEIKTIKVGRQWKNIDVSVSVNDEYFIVIEDKKGTSEHSNQLKRYAEDAKKAFEKSDIKIKLVYFKMEEQGEYRNIEDAGFLLFTRKKMLEILQKYISETNAANRNHIINDYYENLLELDKKINSYKELPLDKWHWYSWQGFYTELQQTFSDAKWGYVANPSGGFLGFSWYWHNSEYKSNDFKFYLQLEQEKLIFRLYNKNPKAGRKIRDYYRRVLYDAAKELGIEVQQYGRIGESMGVAILSKNYRKADSNGNINMNLTIQTLKRAERLLDAVNERLEQSELK